SLMACSETAAPCEKPSSATRGASAAASSSHLSSACAAAVVAAGLRPSSPSIGYQDRPGDGQGGVSGAATDATAIPVGRNGTRENRSFSSEPCPCKSTSSGRPSRSPGDQRVALASIISSLTQPSCQRRPTLV